MARKNLGILYIIISAFCFALMNLFVRLSGDIPLIEKTFFRNLVALIVAFLILLKEKPKMKAEKEDIGLLFLRAAMGTLGMWCNFYAIDHLHIADASMLNKLSPFFVILFSYLFLKEKISWFQAGCVFLAFVGALFIIKPGVMNMDVVPALLGALGGMGAGAAYTCVRKLGERGIPGSVIVFFFSTFSCLAAVPYCLLHYVPVNHYQLLMLLLAGSSAAGGQFAITAAYTYSPAREISVYDYTQIIFATLLGFFVLGEIPDKYSFIGYAIICIASVMMFLYNNQKTNLT